MISKIILALCACCAGSALGAAEIAYVTDSLRLGLHRADDTSDAPFQNLLSGAALEVLERNANFAHVRTEDGQEGWVKTTYLVGQKPAIRRVAELEVEVQSLRAELNASRQLAADTPDSLPARADRAADDGGAGAVADLRVENARLEATLEQFRGSLPVVWVIGALVVVGAGGFLTGLWWLDALIRRRHGGFRVY
jgi:SH3 domain protein